MLRRAIIAIPKSTDAGHIAQNFDIFDFALTDESRRGSTCSTATVRPSGCRAGS